MADIAIYKEAELAARVKFDEWRAHEAKGRPMRIFLFCVGIATIAGVSAFLLIFHL